MGNDLMPVQDKTPESEWGPVFDLWKKYEDIAMHFNDLLMKLRTQALGAVAAISTLVGLFGRTRADNRESWEIAAVVFFFLCIFWIAIWIIDFRYYNRLLSGAVDAILELERGSKPKLGQPHINISTKIQEAVAGKGSTTDGENPNWTKRLKSGRWLFYSIVFMALLGALIFSFYETRFEL